MGALIQYHVDALSPEACARFLLMQPLCLTFQLVHSVGCVSLVPIARVVALHARLAVINLASERGLEQGLDFCVTDRAAFHVTRR